MPNFLELGELYPNISLIRLGDVVLGRYNGSKYPSREKKWYLGITKMDREMLKKRRSDFFDKLLMDTNQAIEKEKE